jgi:hypothetical protein
MENFSVPNPIYYVKGTPNMVRPRPDADIRIVLELTPRNV